jgi:hypothetical protein
MRISSAGFVRTPYIVALGVTVVLGGLVFLNQRGIIYLPLPSDDLTAAILAGSVVKLTNEERDDSNLAPLMASPLLTRAAQMKADDMAAKGYYAHISPDGTAPPYWLDAVGYRYQIMGENLVVDRTDSEQVVSAWMGSATHRQNILNPTFTEIGIGVAYGTYKGDDTIYVVQMLAKPVKPTTSVAASTAPRPVPKPAPAPTPVVPAPRPAVEPTPVPVTSTPTPTPQPARPPVTPAQPPAPAPTRPAVTPAPRPAPVVPEAPPAIIVVANPLAPIFETVASSAPFSLPEIATPDTYPEPALAGGIAPTAWLRQATPNEVPPRTDETIGTRVLTFLEGVGAQMRSFFNP